MAEQKLTYPNTVINEATRLCFVMFFQPSHWTVATFPETDAWMFHQPFWPPHLKPGQTMFQEQLLVCQVSMLRQNPSKLEYWDHIMPSHFLQTAGKHLHWICSAKPGWINNYYWWWSKNWCCLCKGHQETTRFSITSTLVQLERFKALLACMRCYSEWFHWQRTEPESCNELSSISLVLQIYNNIVLMLLTSESGNHCWCFQLVCAAMKTCSCAPIFSQYLRRSCRYCWDIQASSVAWLQLVPSHYTLPAGTICK